LAPTATLFAHYGLRQRSGSLGFAGLRRSPTAG
jgi:hypothetical protein